MTDTTTDRAHTLLVGDRPPDPHRVYIEKSRTAILAALDAALAMLHDPDTDSGTRLFLIRTLLDHGIGKKD